MAQDFSKMTDEELEAIISGSDAPQAPRPAGTNPATGQQFTAPEMVSAVLGTDKPTAASEIEPSAFKRGVAGAGMALEDKFRGLMGKPRAEDYGLREDTAGQFGAMIPDAVGSMLAPARVLPQAAYGFATRAMEPADNVLDRGIAGLKGAGEFGAGQAVASGVVRGINAATGDLTRAGQYAKASKDAGLDLSAGDLTNSNLLRTMEEKSFASPSARQGEQVGALMNHPQGDPISKAVKDAYAVAQGKVSSAASELDNLIQTQNLPGVVPRNTYDAVRQIAARSPDTLNNVRDPQLKQMLDDIANYPTNRIPKSTEFSRLDELRKVLGPVMAKVDMQSKSGASNINAADAARWKTLYKSIMQDIEGWGSSKATEEALAAHKTLSSTFKNEVLPLREHPFAGKILDEGYARPEHIIRDLTSAQNRSVINDLYGRLDQGGKNAFDAFRSAKRGSREFRTEEPKGLQWEKPLALTGAAALPFIPGGMAALPWAAGAVGVEQALVHGLNSPLGRAVLSGSPQASRSPLLNAAAYSGLRSGAQEAGRGGLEALYQTQRR